MGTTHPLVASWHHQAIARPGEGVDSVGWAEDGLIEAIECRTGWVIGVQWHPEETAANDPAQQGLFDELVRQARAYRERREPTGSMAR
jgi:putative glutamine amidotransferase